MEKEIEMTYEQFIAEWDAKIEAAAESGDEELVEQLMIEQQNAFLELFPL